MAAPPAVTNATCASSKKSRKCVIDDTHEAAHKNPGAAPQQSAPVDKAAIPTSAGGQFLERQTCPGRSLGGKQDSGWDSGQSPRREKSCPL